MHKTKLDLADLTLDTFVTGSEGDLNYGHGGRTCASDSNCCDWTHADGTCSPGSGYECTDINTCEG